jgi:hypothetical protein
MHEEVQFPIPLPLARHHIRMLQQRATRFPALSWLHSKLLDALLPPMALCNFLTMIGVKSLIIIPGVWA